MPPCFYLTKKKQNGYDKRETRMKNKKAADHFTAPSSWLSAGLIPSRVINP